MQVRKRMQERAKDGTLKPAAVNEQTTVSRKRGRWDKTADGEVTVPAKKPAIATTPMESPWEKDEVRFSFQYSGLILFHFFFLSF